MNVLGYVYPTKALLPAMIQRREGRVVFVSSQAGQVGSWVVFANIKSKPLVQARKPVG